MEQTQSDNISALANALVKVQSKIEGAKKLDINYYSKTYANLRSIWDCCRELLVENGLCVIQTNGGTAEAPSVITTLAHTSGEWIRGELSMIPDKKGPQGIGSAISYARRYALAGIIGIYQEDDDAEGATKREKEKQAPKDTSKAGVDDIPMGDSPNPKLITEKQRGRLKAKATANNWAVSAVKSMLAKHGFDNSANVTKEKYAGIIDELEHGMEEEYSNEQSTGRD